MHAMAAPAHGSKQNTVAKDRLRKFRRHFFVATCRKSSSSLDGRHKFV